MKYFFTAIIVLSFTSPRAQELFPLKDGRVVYEAIDSVKGKSKNDIFIISKQWIADNFKSAKSVIELQDQDAGKLTGKFSFTNMYAGAIPFYYKATFTIDCRDNKARLKIYDINYTTDRTGTQFFLDERLEFQKNKGRDNSKDELWISLNNTITGLMDGYKTYISAKAKDEF